MTWKKRAMATRIKPLSHDPCGLVTPTVLGLICLRKIEPICSLAVNKEPQ
jgi:hypothetical protein